MKSRLAINLILCCFFSVFPSTGHAIMISNTVKAASETIEIDKASDSRKNSSENKWVFNGKLRINSFFHDRKGSKEDYGASYNRYAHMGGALYDPRGFVTLLGVDVQTPEINNWQIKASHYIGTDFGTLDHEDARYGKSGKDTFVTDRTTFEPKRLNVTGQIYLHHEKGRMEIKLGRFIHNSMFTQANDSKAVPNTFSGMALSQKGNNNDRFSFAFLTQQKLRNRNSFHDLLRFGTTEHDNDDSGSHKGLTGPRLAAANKPQSRLILMGYQRKEKKWNCKLEFLKIPEMFSTALLDGILDLNTPRSKNHPLFSAGFRYLQQFDNGAGSIGGGRLDGSGTPANGALNARMWMAKLQARWNASTIWLGHSRVAEKGDFVTPWRGFPTHGFTRNATEVNWTAGTRSTMLMWQYDLTKARVWKGAKLYICGSTHDRPETPGKVSADARVIQTDVVYQIPETSVELKIRNVAHFGKAEQDFRDSRIEMNYLF